MRKKSLIARLACWPRLSIGLRSAAAALALMLSSSAALGLTTANFVPLAAGNSWTYSVVENGIASSETETVTPSMAYFGDSRVFEILSSDGSRSYELADAAGYREFGGYSAMSGATYTFSPPAVIAPAAFELGQTHAGTSIATYAFAGAETLSGPVSHSTTAVGFESVSVPAGTFHALRIESQIATALSSASGVSISLSATQTHWLAENVGIVKSTYADSEGQTETRELVSFFVPGGGVTLNFSPGWNLAGNSAGGVLNVANTFGDGGKVTTVWKWIGSKSKWAFYAPSEPDGGAAYAAGKGYDFLTTIGGGEGFWVNAKNAFAAPLPSGTAIASASFQGIGGGWSLISVGDSPTPSRFNKALSTSPPSGGEIPLNVITLWAWDSALSNWYFYAPSLENDGTLAAYIASKNYLDFGAKKLEPATGFWVNRGASNPTAPADAPAAGAAVRLTLTAGAANTYTVAVTPGERYTVAISGLSASIALSVYHDSGMSAAACSSGPSQQGQYCTLIAASSVLTIKLDASAAPSAASVILGIAANPIIAAPTSQSGASVAPGIPLQGQVAPRGTSSYAASGLTAGQPYTVSISGLSEDADLRVFTDGTYSMELDCTLLRPGDIGVSAEECTTAPGGSLYFQVRAGELNTNGASYIVIVR